MLLICQYFRYIVDLPATTEALQMHLPVAKETLGGHVLGNPSNSTRRADDDPFTLVTVAEA